ncbi:leucyl-tRNA synthetase [Flavobacterium rivuli WB 3.3-2 = DSM 21788]|uniref:Leucine--tRNA ligase n=1 Tax=Flavobacterium rivuli WB 3.3-2 = DSM 21788 TaxID=1121895 RepID=A0A0A2MG59_9FLAO|nr:class I tRNA ligase family protein [Flavobacterium rivuli]KGO87290.1 leucyl-tRNA synthetase [Flavobacterium rivuli WB 3.3-2 = DSM 21788]
MRYDHKRIEDHWQKYWAENGTFQAEDKSDKPKYYVLDMFPYPSGAGLHVGHPLGYIASDIYARYKRHQGFNVLHPQGYDSFGLPAEQYAIQTGQHPAVTTEANINRYREQLDKIGFSFDWDREVRTSSPEYYKWTQWIFIELFNSWYNKNSDKAEHVDTLIGIFETEGNANVNAVSDDNIAVFTAADWKGYTKDQQEKIVLKYRLTYLAETEVNWCPALGTVLANDEIVNGVSERGGYPVIRKKMTQWSMRISAYAERLLTGLDTIDWTESLKESQRNWIGKSVGASVVFRVIDGLTPDPSPKERGASSTPGYQTADKTIVAALVEHGKNNRKDATQAEALLWEALRNKNLGFKFRRQHAIGKYIADFVALEKRLIVEVDGGYHNSSEQNELDENRTLELEQKHFFKVLRFTNEQVTNDINSVLTNIRIALSNRKSYKVDDDLSDAPPLSKGEGLGVRPEEKGRTSSFEENTQDGLTINQNGNPSILEGLGLKDFFEDITDGFEDHSADANYTIEVFTTRPDTIFGVTFMTLAPEHDLVAKITTPAQKAAVEEYVQATAKRSERERMADVKTISGVFTGAYAEHPFTKEPIPVWIGDYVLAGYGTGAVMAVPAGDQRDYDFAKHFGIDIKNIFDGQDISVEAYGAKDNVKLQDSDFLDGANYKEATKKVVKALEGIQQGKGKTNYRLRDAVFSRQRYWGEPFPVYYVNGSPQLIDVQHLPIRLPDVEKYLPTEDGQPPLGNSREWAWSITENKVVSNDLIDEVTVFPLELNTMPGWAGSSWYWLRYMDPHNNDAFVSKEAEDYWQDVDLYIGGSEHATGHLLYSRFWNKFLKDRGFVKKEEPFKKLINQGMILGTSAFVYRLSVGSSGNNNEFGLDDVGANLDGLLISYYYVKECINIFEKSKADKHFRISFKRDGVYVGAKIGNNILENLSQKLFSLTTSNTTAIHIGIDSFQKLHVDVSFVNASDELDIEAFKEWRSDYNDAKFITEDNGKYIVGREVEKMSKSKYNVVTPDLICEQYGADTLRLYEMFLGPLEQAKPWNTAGITGVSGFLKKLWKLYFDDNGLIVTANPATPEALKILHRTIKKTQDDIENFSFNTSVSAFMIAVNELTAINCHERSILEPLSILISPYAPHIAEELWKQLGHQTSISTVPFPHFNPEYLVESSKEYPVSFNGKMRFKIELPMDLTIEQIQEAVMADERTIQQLNGQQPKKFVIVPGKIINLVG